MPSSQGEFTLQLETRTLRQQSMSMPSRLVSIFRLSMVRLSTPVARMPKWPPCRIEKSRRRTLWQFFSAMALLPTPGSSACGAGRLAAAQSFAPDQARTEDGDILQAFAPDQAVVPVIVAIVLIGFPGLVRFGRVVACTSICSRDRRPGWLRPAKDESVRCSSSGSSSRAYCRREDEPCRRPPPLPRSRG